MVDQLDALEKVEKSGADADQMPSDDEDILGCPPTPCVN